MTEPPQLTYRRVHRASRELLFRCMTTPAHLAQFWGPIGTTTPVARITVELHSGGAFEAVIVSDADGSEHTMRAVYEAVDPPALLVWREIDSGMTTTITFTDLGDGTTEVVTHETAVPARYLTPEARAGWESSLDRFGGYIVRLVTPG